jgi:ABC-2 type transport system ATP-binding protein
MITIDNLQKSFDGVPAVRSLSLSVQPGSIYALLGPNGAGKSTTIHCILGFLKPEAGRIELNGVPIDAQAKRGSLAYIPENLRLYDMLTGAENLAYFTSIRGKTLSKPEQSSYLEQAGLAREHHDRLISTYSKGMRQKIGIAIASAVDANVLLLDEPASGLDPRAASDLTRLLKERARKGVAILLTTHDLFWAWDAADMIGIMEGGRVVVESPAADITFSELESLYLQHIQSS